MFEAVGHGGGHMAELFRRGSEWLLVLRRTLYRSEAHHQECRTACITLRAFPGEQGDASKAFLDRKAALAVLSGTGEIDESLLRSSAVSAPASPAHFDMLTNLRARRVAASVNPPKRRE